MSGQRIPLTAIEEVWQRADHPDEPNSMQIEIRVTGAIDEQRLANAVQAAIAKHPMTRVRLRSKRRRLHPPEWELVVGAGTDVGAVLSVTSCESDAELEEVRESLYSRTIALDQAPTLHFVLVHRLAGDSLLLTMHHAISDGMGALRFLRSVARAYAGDVDTIPDVDPISVRDLRSRSDAAPAPASTSMSRLMRRQRLLSRRPSLAAPSGGAGGPGYGFCHVALSADATRHLNPRHVVSDATMNDLLLAAFHLTLEQWNTTHGAAAERITTVMPANSRPPSHRDEFVSNLSLAGRVSTTAAQRAAPDLLMRSIIEQTAYLKVGGIPAMRAMPPWVTQLSMLILPLLFRAVPFTGILSNLGRLDHLADFGPGAGEATELWITGPISMPVGITVAVATVQGRLNLTLRYRLALFDATAGQQFLDGLVAALLELGGGVVISETGVPSRSGMTGEGRPVDR